MIRHAARAVLGQTRAAAVRNVRRLGRRGYDDLVAAVSSSAPWPTAGRWARARGTRSVRRQVGPKWLRPWTWIRRTNGTMHESLNATSLTLRSPTPRSPNNYGRYHYHADSSRIVCWHSDVCGDDGGTFTHARTRWRRTRRGLLAPNASKTRGPARCSMARCSIARLRAAASFPSRA